MQSPKNWLAVMVAMVLVCVLGCKSTSTKVSKVKSPYFENSQKTAAIFEICTFPIFAVSYFPNDDYVKILYLYDNGVDKGWGYEDTHISDLNVELRTDGSHQTTCTIQAYVKNERLRSRVVLLVSDAEDVAIWQTKINDWKKDRKACEGILTELYRAGKNGDRYRVLPDKRILVKD